MRKCKQCKVERPIEEFPTAGKVKGVHYRRYLCTQCYSKSKLPRKEKMREMYIKLKKEFKCFHCGNDDYRVLEFDHKGNKKFDLGNAIGRGYSFDTILQEAKKCQVLCANCHRIKTFEERIGA